MNSAEFMTLMKNLSIEIDRECDRRGVNIAAIAERIGYSPRKPIFEETGTGGLRLAGRDGEPIERELDGAGVERVWSDGEWRTPA